MSQFILGREFKTGSVTRCELRSLFFLVFLGVDGPDSMDDMASVGGYQGEAHAAHIIGTHAGRLYPLVIFEPPVSHPFRVLPGSTVRDRVMHEQSRIRKHTFIK